MKKFLERKEGITLIALVITIIIMIVLASVSINAIVGDNGIITQAQNATVQNSIANLEEYLQEIYIENYDTIASSSYESKLEALAGITEYKYYFYNPSRDSEVGALSYISTSDGYVLYLINKSELPEEIQEQLIGGDAGDGEYSDYASLNDVYGVTKDLKVYYCSGGIDTITGIASTELDTDNLSRTVFASSSNSNWYNLLSSYDTNNDGELSVQELRSVKKLTINSSSGISSLSELYNLTSLQELTLDSLEIDNIDGIENAVQIYYVYFKSCVIGDYTALCEVNNLTYLYFYDIDDDELETVCTDIATAKFSKLTYLAVVGNTQHISSTFTSEDTSSYSTKSTNTITSLKSLSLLSSVTKNAVKYLSIQNNNIEGDLSYISDYTNLILLRCEYNSITNLNGLEDMDNLKYLCGSYNNLGNGESDDSDTSLNSLNGNTSLYALNLVYNTDLAYVDDLEECTGIQYLYLASCSSKMSVTTIANAKIIDNCIDYSLPIMYLNGTIFKLSDYFIASEFTDSQLRQYLKNNKTITHLNLENATSLTNDALNEVLETMTQLKYVTLRGCTGLETIDFVHELTEEDEDGNQTGVIGLIELDLRDTNENLTDLTALNDYAESLGSLRISNTNINLTTIQNTISNLTGKSYWYGSGYGGLLCTEFSLLKQLESCSEITRLYSFHYSYQITSSDTLDLSLCTSLKTVVIAFWTFNIIFPNTVTSVSILNCPLPSFSYGSSLTSLQCSLVSGSSVQWQNFFNNLNSNVYSISSLIFDRVTDSRFSFEYLTSDIEFSITSLQISSYGSAVVLLDSLSGVRYLANTLTSLHLENLDCLENFDDIAYLTNLTNLSIINSDFYNMEVLENLASLKTLILNDNSISILKPIENLNKLSTLNLKNNVIYDASEDSDGNTINNLQILIDLYEYGSLRTLYLSGNIGLNTESTEYKTLVGLNWTASDF